MDNDTCDCVECKDSENPCHFDCDLDSMCEGCTEAKAYADDIRYEYERA